MQLEIKTQGVDFVVSRAPQPKNDNDGQQKADRDTGELLQVTELVTMDDTGAEVLKVITAGEPGVTKRQLVTVVKLVATPWNIDGRGGVAFRADSIGPVPTAAPTAGFGQGQRCRGRCLMSTPTITDPAQLEAAYTRTEQLLLEAAEACRCCAVALLALGAVSEELRGGGPVREISGAKL
jgi:hypothetical protein